jgi:DNA invertase Pin-like site-specific DNA recombinase
MKRAAIYIRVSPERQAEKVSPEAQEADCVAYCEAHNYQVFGIYRDAEKYRVGSRLVEPSRTRFDRPQFLRMLADSDAG